MDKSCVFFSGWITWSFDLRNSIFFVFVFVLGGLCQPKVIQTIQGTARDLSIGPALITAEFGLDWPKRPQSDFCRRLKVSSHKWLMREQGKVAWCDKWYFLSCHVDSQVYVVYLRGR